MTPKVFTSELTFGPCSRCDGILVQRTNRKTMHTFLGCSRWPACKYTKRGGSNPGAPRVFVDLYDDPFDENPDMGDGFDDDRRSPWDDVFSQMDWGDND